MIKVCAQLIPKSNTYPNPLGDTQRLFLISKRGKREIAKAVGDWKVTKYSNNKYKIEISDYRYGSWPVIFRCDEIYIGDTEYTIYLMMNKLQESK